MDFLNKILDPINTVLWHNWVLYIVLGVGVQKIAEGNRSPRRIVGGDHYDVQASTSSYSMIRSGKIRRRLRRQT